MIWKDWFNKNLYVTTPQDPDPFFRPRKYAKTREEVAKVILETLSGMPRWKVVEYRENQGRIRATCAAKILPFADDVDIYIVQGLDGVTKVEVVSRAQGGKGDFGRNKRNVRELLTALEPMLPTLPS